MIGGLSWLKIGGGVLGLVALAALLWAANDRFKQKEKADAARECAAAAADETAPFDELDACLPPVKRRVEAARRADVCDDAIGNPLVAEARFAVRMSCSEPVKKLVADRDGKAVTIADLKQQLDDLQQDSREAVARAERRAGAAQERSERAKSAIDAAPRGDDGRVRCDAKCLRDLFG